MNFQEQLRRRKDEEEKQEYLNRSLRGSRKLQALESHATSLSGQENLAYAQDEVTIVGKTQVTLSHVSKEVEEPPRPLSKFLEIKLNHQLQQSPRLFEIRLHPRESINFHNLIKFLILKY